MNSIISGIYNNKINIDTKLNIKKKIKNKYLNFKGINL